MATYAIGDVQGCFDSLTALLDRIAFDPERDRLLFAGDLVNRGPKSLEVLRWARDTGEAVTTVLGNHDVHLLARAAGVGRRKRRDTLGAVLHAPDRDELVEWLRRRPLVHREGRDLLVHAGLHPEWTADEACALAREVEGALLGDGWAEVLAGVEAEPPRWSPSLCGLERLRAIAGVLLRVRTIRGDGSLCNDFSGPPRAAPAGCVPWFEARRVRDARVLFGHWSTLGLAITDDHVALDSGCVWGGHLTAHRLEDGATFQVACVDPPVQRPNI